MDTHHSDGYTIILQWALDALTRPPRLTVSQWADEHRILPTAGSSEPGPWRTSRTPYLQEIMDCLGSDHPARRIIFQKAAQIGASEALLNAVGSFIATERSPLLIVQPSHEMAERFSKQRLAPMIEDSPQLRSLIRPARMRDSGNTLFSKSWPGGIVILAGANSPASLRSMPARHVLCDEVDGYAGDVGGEGDPVTLAEARSTAFPGRKLFLISTPTVNSLSRIVKEYEASDQRRYWVPCPECHEYQILQWENLNWPPGNPRQAAYVCEHCGCLISERHKAAMLRKGQWRPTHPEREVIGFHLSALYSAPGLGLTWKELAAQWEEAQLDPAKMRAFINLRLGLPTTDPDDQLDESELQGRADAYPVRSIPPGALWVSAGVDVQKDRLAMVLLGFGRNSHIFVIDWIELRGDPTRPDVWRDLDAYLDQPLQTGDQTLRIAAVAIDSGYLPDHVLAYTRARKGRVIATRGSTFKRRPLIAAKPSKVDYTQRGKTLSGGAEVWFVGTDTGKELLFTRLASDREAPPEDRSFHFASNLDKSFYSQLTAEMYDRRNQRWIKIRPRNESLDCTLLAIAASMQPRFRIHLAKEAFWQKMENQRHTTSTPSTPATPPAPHISIDPEPKPQPAPPLPKPKAQPNSFIARPAGQSWIRR